VKQSGNYNPSPSARKNKRNPPFGGFFIFPDEQLQNMQKQICLIEFLRYVLFLFIKAPSPSASNIEHPVVIPRDVLFCSVSGDFCGQHYQCI